MATAGELCQEVQYKLNDYNGEYYTTTICLSAMNRVLKALSRETLFLATHKGVITIPNPVTTHEYAMPTVNNVGKIFLVSQHPVWDLTNSDIYFTDEAYLVEWNSNWRDLTTDGAPTYCKLNGLGDRIQFIPGPTTVGATISVFGYCEHFTMGVNDTPLLPDGLQPVLIWGTILDLADQSAEAKSIQAKLPNATYWYNKYREDLMSTIRKTRIPRFVRSMMRDYGSKRIHWHGPAIYE